MFKQLREFLNFSDVFVNLDFEIFQFEKNKSHTLVSSCLIVNLFKSSLIASSGFDAHT